MSIKYLFSIGIFATYPQQHLSILGGLLDQIIGTVFLILVVLALTDKKNAGIGFGMVALSVGFTISAIGLAFGHNSGFAINPGN
jgi:glycerol uptake facilitator protein